MDEENLGYRNKTKDASSRTTEDYISSSSSSSSIQVGSGHLNDNKDNIDSFEQTSFEKWKPWLLWWNTEEWMACWIGLIIFGGVTATVLKGIPCPVFKSWQHNPFMTFADVGNYGLIVLFFVMGGLLWIAMACYRPSHWQLFPIGYVVIFFVALISNMLASNAVLHSASLGASIWAIILGCVLRNLLGYIYKHQNQPLPHWIKIAQQTELYIAISLVLLCIDIAVLKPLAPRALFVSWLDTPTLFMVVAFIGWRYLDIDKQTSIIMSGATFICGSSAAIALGSAMGVPHKTDMPIAIISIFTIPSIIALPYIAKSLEFDPNVAGAWFGGCVDSTGAVIASASIYNDPQAISTSAVVKMMQNVLIGPLSVIMAWLWSQYELRLAHLEEQERLQPDGQETSDIPLENRNKSDFTRSSKTVKKQEKALVLLWKRFPKFVLGFIITAVLFNTVIPGGPDERAKVKDYCFYVSEYFSTLSFVSIGLGLKMGELKQNIRSLGKLCVLYLIAQLVDIIVTAVLAWLAFTKM
ncbi:uncharacterized protein BX664DRAFT_328023 [Halteromyces radiatus]|uniref:uncharacterized protein n=1 Tax=Halteromyces radiatus TaxID=101107 RepID=UPI00221E90AE|nr:uncharacterized protein BX664DRAFT_328023 [Halteromyces radiatus]KAI8092740.1 hypothetical protein BX664DRAFT_328023 [Halteromyces radiatus]